MAPHDTPDRPFDAPWQAQAFALTVHLSKLGVFSWSEWADYLSAALRREQPAMAHSNADYYRCWLIALGEILATKGHAPVDDVALLTQAWQRAARATPHGTPIDLQNDPEAALQTKPG